MPMKCQLFSRSIQLYVGWFGSPPPHTHPSTWVRLCGQNQRPVIPTSVPEVHQSWLCPLSAKTSSSMMRNSCCSSVLISTRDASKPLQKLLASIQLYELVVLNNKQPMSSAKWPSIHPAGHLALPAGWRETVARTGARKVRKAARRSVIVLLLLLYELNGFISVL